MSVCVASEQSYLVDEMKDKMTHMLTKSEIIPSLYWNF